MEKTLVLIKPDAFSKHYSGDIIKRYEAEGFRIVAMKLLKMDERLASIHYAEHIGRPYYKDLVAFMTSAPLIAMVLAGDDVIKFASFMAKLIQLRLNKELFANNLLKMVVATQSMLRIAQKVLSGKYTFSLMKPKYLMVSIK